MQAWRLAVKNKLIGFIDEFGKYIRIFNGIESGYSGGLTLSASLPLKGKS